MKKEPVICVLDGYTLNPGDLSWNNIASLGSFRVYDRSTPEQIIPRAKDADIILTNKMQITADVLEQLPNLKYIGEQATGFNNIDTIAAKKRNIIVTNIPAYSTLSVAQMVFAQILNITNRVEHYTNEIRNGIWSKSPDFCYWNTPLTEIAGKKLGIVGLGHTGSAVAKIGEAFGMEIYAFTSKSLLQLPKEIHKMELDELFETCDIISLHCPLTKDTNGMINTEKLKRMKKTAILINTSRGQVVNEQDVADALNTEKIAAFGTDVSANEPPDKNNPLLTAKNCFITPHIAWASREARQRLMDILESNVRMYLNGTPQNVINQ